MKNGVRSSQKQQGVALIVVLMLVALVVIVATEMGSRLQLQVTRATNIKDNNQAYWYAMGAEQFAQKSIIEIFEKNKDVVSLEGGWSEEFTFPLEGGGIQAQLFDMQTCFNLNGIDATNSQNNNPQNNDRNSQNSSDNNSNDRNSGNSNNNQQNNPNGMGDEAIAFERLLTNVVPELDNYSAEVVRDSLVDWLDEDDNLSQNGAEDADYAALVNPYLAANAPMVSKSEIRLVNGVQPQWINALLPYICVIPNVSQLKINVNTITEEQAQVLAALTDAPLSDMQSLISNRPPDGFQDRTEFLQDQIFSNITLSQQQQDWFDVTTEYFLLRTKTRYNNASFAMSSLYKYEDGKVSVIRREFGGEL